MKRYLLFCSIVFLFFGCQNDDVVPGILNLSKKTFVLDYKQQTLKVAIGSNQPWEVSGVPAWCQVDKLKGEGNDTLRVSVDLNSDEELRNATVVVRNRDLRKPVQITQEGLGDYHYRLPVIFHILYNDPNDPKQNPDAQWLYSVLEECNTMYADTERSVDMNLEFIPATHDPQGNLLMEPGIERIQWLSSIQMDCDDFMKDPNIVPYVWDLNQYINIFVYSFTGEGVLGTSYLPYTVSTHALEGLELGDYYLMNPDLGYPHCISVNNRYVLTYHPYLEMKDLVLTLTHELGHYLGLFHVFSEDDGFSDYCDDTEFYDRAAYEAWLSSLSVSLPFEQLAQRTTPEGVNFVSSNIMDYDFSYLNRFTPNQQERVRHVLGYSPLIPGLRIESSRVRSNLYMEKPKPQIIKWERRY